MKILIYTFLCTFLLGASSTVLLASAISTPKLDFLTSMGWYKASNQQYKERFYFNNTREGVFNLKKLFIYEDLYNKNIFTGKPKKKAIIPKIIHQIWLGPKTPPAVFKQSQESIKKYHPDWEYKLWTDKDIPDLLLHNQKFYDLTNNYGAKADILRYELLYKFGGIYLDVDMVCLNPLDILLQYDLWSCVQPLDCKGGLCNCVIGSIPGHPILEHCIASLEESWYKYQKNLRGPMRNVVITVGPFHFERSFMHFVHNKNMNIIALPSSFFFPINFHEEMSLSLAHTVDLDKIIQSFSTPEAFAVHCWAGSWKMEKEQRSTSKKSKQRFNKSKRKSHNWNALKADSKLTSVRSSILQKSPLG